MNTELFAGSSHLRVAFSGGCDSTVLLAMLCDLRASGDLPQKLSAVHVNHGLQAEADSWERHCRTLCADWQVPIEVLQVQVPTSGASAEDRARRARYGVWQQLLAGDELLVLAHHADDQEETVLMRLLRGAGPLGMAGMPVRRSLGAGALVRPLLQVPRAELRAYALERDLNWVEDPDNDNPRNDRNFMRHQVLPLLRSRWPAAGLSIRRSAEIARQTQQLCDLLAEEDLRTWLDRQGRLAVEALANLDWQRRYMLISLWCRKLDLEPPPVRRLAHLHDLLHAADDRAPELRWRDRDGRTLMIRRYRKHLYLLEPPPPVPDTLLWDPRTQNRLELPHGTLSVRPGKGGLNPDLLSGPQVRFRRGGEQLRPTGMRCQRPLRKYLQEQGVPPWQRPGMPLLYSGDSLVAVADLCVCEGFAVAPGEPGLTLSWQVGA